MDTLVALLHAGNHSLVVRNGGAISTFNGRGIADLHRLLHCEPSLLSGAEIADKVVGKGAAALMIPGEKCRFLPLFARYRRSSLLY